MNFRYDFGEKLDLSRFRKQAKHYAKWMPEYDFVMSHFLVEVRLFGSGRIKVAAFDIVKDSDGNIIERAHIQLGLDDRFKDFQDVQFFTEFWTHSFEFEKYIPDLDQSIERICSLIKIFHKINGLKAFL